MTDMTGVSGGRTGDRTPLRRRPAQRRSAERVQRMLDACAEILDEAGYEGLSTTRIAQRAEVAIGSVYQFFPDKRAVAQALALRNLEVFEDRITQRLTDEAFTDWSDTVGAIIDAIADHWGLQDDAEITLEANPTSVEAENFAGYRTAGVNRLSLGVQALDDQSLKSLGRQHSAQEALNALALAKRRFDRVSFDLIYAREGQTAKAWQAELTRALDHAADHLSLYQLTIEEGTPFAVRHAAGTLRIPDSAKARALYQLTQELCETAGLPAYEVSNHARPGSESRHGLRR